jgi:hypothetical protein
MTKRAPISRTVLISEPAGIWFGVGFGLTVAAYFWDTSQSGAALQGLRTLIIGAGSGIAATFLPALLNALFQNIWPRPEFREICAEVWSVQRTQQIEEGLHALMPADALRSVFKGDACVEEFDSNTIYRAIGAMHEGAFLAAVDLWDPENYNEDFLITREGKCSTGLQTTILEYRVKVAKQITDRHIIAARRYRVKASSNGLFIGQAAEQRCARLRSLALLVDNVSFDLSSGWIVDVEYCSADGLHSHVTRREFRHMSHILPIAGGSWHWQETMWAFKSMSRRWLLDSWKIGFAHRWRFNKGRNSCQKREHSLRHTTRNSAVTRTPFQKSTKLL